MKKLWYAFLLSPFAIQALPVSSPGEIYLFEEGIVYNCYDDITFYDATSHYYSRYRKKNYRKPSFFSDRCHLSLKGGYYGDFVFNRKMKIVNGEHEDAMIHRYAFNTNGAYIGLNYYNKCELYIVLGASRFNITTSPSALESPVAISGSLYTFETDSHFSGSIGAKCLVYSCSCLNVALESIFFGTKANVMHLYNPAGDSKDGSSNFKYYESQISLAASYELGNLIPFLGIKCAGSRASDFNHVNLEGTNQLTLKSVKSRYHFGGIGGVTVSSRDMWSLTVEGRWPDEQALYVNSQLKF